MRYGHSNLLGYVLFKSIADNGSLDWPWTRGVVEARLQRLVDRREAREELQREMAGLQPMQADADL